MTVTFRIFISKIAVLHLFILYMSVMASAHANFLTIKLATTDWCPYSCPQNVMNKGIAYDYVQHLLSKYDIDTDIVSFPWARAIRQVETGERHGLLTAVHSESPNLLFTTQPLMSYQMCFYGLPSLAWQFKNKQSLANVNLAVISQYGYGQPVEQHLAEENNRERVIELSGDGGLERLIALVRSGRADVFIEDKNVFNWYKKSSLDTTKNEFKELGCLADTPFYLAVDPALPWSSEVINILNKELAKNVNHQWLINHTEVHYQ